MVFTVCMCKTRFGTYHSIYYKLLLCSGLERMEVQFFLEFELNVLEFRFILRASKFRGYSLQVDWFFLYVSFSVNISK